MRPVAGAGAVIAVDLGGTSIKGAVVDRDGRLLHESRRPTGAQRGPQAVVSELIGLITELRERERSALAVGVVVPGVVDAAAGVARFAANVGFRELALRELLEGALGLPVVLDHDVRAAGVAERAVGASANAEDCFMAVIGTGIAAVITAAGRELRGATLTAGEFGHIPVWPDGEPCACGQRGCLERYASAASIARNYAQLRGLEEVSAGEVASLRHSDPDAARVWAQGAQALAIGLATATMLLDPGLIVLAGGLSEAGEALRAPVADELARRVRWREPPPVVLSRLGGRAGLVGAAVLTWRSLGLEDLSSWARA